MVDDAPVHDDPARRQGGPLTLALLALDGAPAAYAMYRVTQDWHAGSSTGHVRVVEAVAPGAEAARELWRWLLDFDWTSQGRTYAAGDVVLEVEDSFCPWNAGRWRVGGAGVEATEADAKLRLDVADLGSVYLGGFGFADLARASRVEELPAGAIARADALFRTSVEPWCAEIF